MTTKLSQAPREATIVAAVIRYLRSLPHSHAHKVHGGAYGANGEPDIDACVAGRAVKIEVKRPGGPGPTPLQKAALQRWERADAVAFVARSVEDVVDRLRTEGLI